MWRGIAFEDHATSKVESQAWRPLAKGVLDEWGWMSDL
jgi:hypothetical protein